MPKKFYIELTEMDFQTLIPLSRNQEQMRQTHKQMGPDDTLVLVPANALSFSREGDTIVILNPKEGQLDAGDRQDQDS